MPSNPPSELKDEDLIPDLLKERPDPIDYTENTIIVDGCPKVGTDKQEKLCNVLISKFSKHGEIIHHYMPLDKSEQSLGCIFIAYSTKKSAKSAVKEMNQATLDKNHTFQVSLISNFEKAITVSDHFEKPKYDTITDPGNLMWWLQNELCRDQFNITYTGLPVSGSYAAGTGQLFGAVYWSTNAEPILIKQQECWTNKWMIWSPKGSYLATMHTPGVMLWAGEEFARVRRLAHASVRYADFSSNEKFLVSYSKSQGVTANTKQLGNGIMADVIVWNIDKSQAMHEFTMPYCNKPIFKWSPKDTYAACLVNGSIYIYETEEFTQLEKKISVPENKISNFSWSPTEDILAYWVPEKDSTPARVVLMNITNWQEISTKNLFSVAEIQLHWQDNGDYLAVEVLRCAKKKLLEKQIKLMGTFVNVEILRLREKGYPWDKLEVKDCDFNCFGWEPSGHRFAFVTTQTTTNKNSISIFQMMKSGRIKECAVMERANARINELKWSPKGSTLVVCSLHSAESYLEFIDANECHSLSKQEHAMLGEIHWDPTGRYVASCVLQPHKNDNAVWFWSCIGRPIHKMPFKELNTFSWRPRPPTLLTPDEIANVKKNLHTYTAHLESEDKMLASKASRELLEKRQKETNSFNKWRHQLRELFDKESQERETLRASTKEEDNTMVEEVVEVLLERKQDMHKRNMDD